jgi:proteasome lid subunit RPN8/RPN11
MLRIPRKIYRQMVEQAQREFPLECCGLLAGTPDGITHIYPMTNVDQSRVSYSMDPKEQFKTFKQIRDAGVEMRAIYHSHPKHPAYPSATDVRLAYDSEAIYLILSIQDKTDEPLMRGFRIVDGKISEVSFTVEE